MPRKKTFTPTDVALYAGSWDREQLEEMMAILGGLLAVLDSTFAQSQSPIAKSQQQRGGYVEQKMINGCGPYRYLRYWHQGKRKSIYVGKVNGDQSP